MQAYTNPPIRVMVEPMTAWCKSRGFDKREWSAETVDVVARAHGALAMLGASPVRVDIASAWARTSGTPVVAELAVIARSRSEQGRRRKPSRMCGGRSGFPRHESTNKNNHEELMPLVWFLENMERAPGGALHGHGDVMLDPYPDVRMRIAQWYDRTTNAS